MVGMHQKGRGLRGGPEAVRPAVGGGCRSGWGCFSCLHHPLFRCPSLPVASPLPPLLRSIRRKCSKEPLLVLGPPLPFLETFGEEAYASVV